MFPLNRIVGTHLQEKPISYTTEDLQNYKRILETTSAHRKFNDRKPFNSNCTSKYREIFKYLFPPITPLKQKQGTGHFVPAKDRTYINWDDPINLWSVCTS